VPPGTRRWERRKAAGDVTDLVVTTAAASAAAGLTHTGNVVEPLPATIRRQAPDRLGKARIAPRPAGPRMRGIRNRDEPPPVPRTGGCGLSLGIPEDRREAPMLG
jgi:hypothetical protein